MYPPKLIPVLQSPITPCPFDMWKHADIPKWDVFPPNQTQCFIAVLHHVFNMWKHADIPRWDVSSLIKPSHLEPYYTMSFWHVEECRHTQMRCIPPNWCQCFRALLHHVHLTCGSMQRYWNEMYCPNTPVLQSPTKPCPFDMWKHAEIPKWDVSPLMKPSAFIALLHLVCLTCGSM